MRGDDFTVWGSMPDLKWFAAGLRQRWTITEREESWDHGKSRAKRKKFDISID